MRSLRGQKGNMTEKEHEHKQEQHDSIISTYKWREDHLPPLYVLKDIHVL